MPARPRAAASSPRRAKSCSRWRTLRRTLCTSCFPPRLAVRKVSLDVKRSLHGSWLNRRGAWCTSMWTSSSAATFASSSRPMCLRDLACAREAAGAEVVSSRCGEVHLPPCLAKVDLHGSALGAVRDCSQRLGNYMPRFGSAMVNESEQRCRSAWWSAETVVTRRVGASSWCSRELTKPLSATRRRRNPCASSTAASWSSMFRRGSSAASLRQRSAL